MHWPAVCVLITLFYHGDGVTTTSGLSQFWTDDYRVFDQVYGKTSDRDIYGDSLPAAINFNGKTKPETTVKKEKFLLSDVSDSFETGSRYDNIIKQTVSLGKVRKPPKSYNFVSYEGSKPISQESDPETYNYLKHLENREKVKKAETEKLDLAKSVDGLKAIGSAIDSQLYDYLKYLASKKEKEEVKKEFPNSVGGFRQHLNYEGKSPDEAEGYESIQDILKAHEANQGGPVESQDVQTNDPTSPSKLKSAKTKPPRVHNEVKTRCQLGRCKKRAASSYRVRTRPYLRRVKHRIVGYYF